MSGGFDLQFQPQGREIDYWLGQIPTISVLGGQGLTLIGALSIGPVHSAYYSTGAGAYNF